ncbi:MAG: glycosyltransferase family 2 protein [Phycisphaerales bacterium]
MPMFSVIIPTYNRERYIAGTLRSAFAQTFSDFEVIVVDDQSTDNTVEIARTFGDRVRVFEQRNSGPGAARNLGAKHAMGRYLAFLDSDDLWFPWTLETIRQVVETCDQPAVITGQPFFFDDEGALGAVPCRTLRVDRFADYLASNATEILPGAAFMTVRADAFAGVGGFTSRRVYSEDADLYLRLGEAPGHVSILAPYTVAYRRHPGSALHDTRRVAEGIEMMLDHEAQGAYPGGEARRGKRWHILAHTARNVAANAARSGMPGLALRLYRRSFRANLAQGRWKFLIALPMLAAGAALRIIKPAELHGAGARRASPGSA